MGGSGRNGRWSLTEVYATKTPSAKCPLDDEIRQTVRTLLAALLDGDIVDLHGPLLLLEDLGLRLDPFMERRALGGY